MQGRGGPSHMDLPVRKTDYVSILNMPLMAHSGAQSADRAADKDTLTALSGKKQERKSRTGVNEDISRGSGKVMGVGGHTGPHIEHSWLRGTAHMAELLRVCFLIFKMRITTATLQI